MNQEKILIQGKFKKNFLPYVFFGIAILAVLFLYTGDYLIFLFDENTLPRWLEWYSKNPNNVPSLGEYLDNRWATWHSGLYFNSIIDDYSQIYTWIGFGVFVIIGIVLLLCWRCELTVTDRRIYGKIGFGKRVDLPLNQVSAIGMGAFSNVSVATSSGSLHFWLVKNKDEVYEVISGLLNQMQTTSPVVPVAPVAVAPQPEIDTESNNMEKLKKYKELLDAGIITQEEFDAKKKQLLDL